MRTAVAAIRLALEQTPPELCADVAERGIVLTGGGALLRDIDKLLMEETGLPVVIAEDPLTCVARGGGRILELQDAVVERLGARLDLRIRLEQRAMTFGEPCQLRAARLFVEGVSHGVLHPAVGEQNPQC